ncbi:MAG: alkaline phosphatase family protein [Clostridiales bacterium]|jgi:predicted AlkP superfamily pyrophosphatase or phosphodiesterase|nr:alkaline phosphatase family protein [Clostridiales bacterium]
MSKAALIAIDGMRPDAIALCRNRFLADLIPKSAACLDARTVMPSVTLPAFMSMFHSVEPGRHGITDNVFTPQARPVAGLCEQIRDAGKKSAFFYNWGPLRDLARPESLAFSYCNSCYHNEDTDAAVAEAASAYIREAAPDFAFVYLGETDSAGHGFGWMGERYLETLSGAIGCVEKVCAALPESYAVLIASDHGGHERMHGTSAPEDMTIPIVAHGKDFRQGNRIRSASILDIAPTVADILGIAANAEWEGRSLRGGQ